MVGTIILGLAMTVFWAIGWQETSIWAFVIGAALRLITIGYQTSMIAKGVTGDPGLREASVAYVQSNEPRRFFAQFGLTRVSEAAAWPFVELLNIFFGLVVLLLTPARNNMTRERTIYYVGFRCPPPLLSLAAHGLQAWFLTAQYSPATQTSVAFKAAVAIQIAGFVALGLHFLAQRKFMKNFSTSGLSPSAYVAANTVLAIGAAAMVRIVAAIAFGASAPTVNGEELFRAVRALAINEDLFDIVDVLRKSETWDAFTSEVSAAAAGITWLGSLDAFLSTFVVVTPIRALWSSITYKRDDDDRFNRALYFLTAGRNARACAEADKMDSVAEAASVKALAALCDGDYEAFVHELDLVDGSAKLAAAGRDPDTLRHIHFIEAMSLAPINAERFADLLEAFWQERKRLASVLILSSWIAESHGGREALEKAAAGRSWGDAISEVFTLIEEHLKSGDGFAEAVSERYSQQPVSLALAVVVAYQHFGSLVKNPARRERARKQIEMAVKEITKQIQSADKGDGLAFAMLGQFYGLPAHFKTSFGVEPVAWTALIDAMERKMVASGLKLTPAYGNIRSANIQY
ncbi:hypothetical protein MUY35_09315 [Aliiroseovarius sp. S1339]|uniref:hypothetical protein n=1 Tax=Aliiroseovarius sp. S1339 TaxID=2936990 RepID=UPI0020BDE450|nr:hypothetical protein [Aliiroseovarius sp. S1339]MCK8464047.1 hypothetical protein [Aliiroseovarius sp. S1339]